MAEKVNDFLKKYYKQLHFNSMPPEVRKRFDSWVRAGTITDEMKLWADAFLQKGPDGKFVTTSPTSKEYQRIPMLDPSNNTDIEDTELEKLFRLFQDAFTRMYAAKATFKDHNPQALEFLENNFGTSALDGKLFHMPEATPGTVAAINHLLYDDTALHTPLLENPDIQKYLVDNTQKPSGDGKYFDSIDDFTGFLAKVKDGKYNTDFKVRDQLCQVADVLGRAVGWSSSIQPDSTVYQAISGLKYYLDQIIQDDAFEETTITPEILNRFRRGEAKRLLDELYEYPNIFAEFSKHDNGKISKNISKGKDNAKWHDPKDENYVKPDTPDKPNMVQAIQKWADDTYKNCFRKYEKLRGDRIFFKNESKAIFKAIDKNEIKPTDGLAALLKKADDITKKIDDPLSKQHFKWFTDVMTEISAESPKAVEGCWKNAAQMKLVIERLMLKAVRDSKSDIHAIDKAKTAMEIMTTMKYGMLTSKVMDALRGTDVKIFSDSDLSWNKNKAMQFITNAFDRTLKEAFMTVGYVATFFGNKIRLSNPQIRKQSKTLSPLVRAEQDRINTERARRASTRDANIADANARIATARGDLLTLDTHGYSSATIEGRTTDRDAHKTEMDRLLNIYNEYNEKADFRHQYEDEEREITTRRSALATHQADLHEIDRKLSLPDLGSDQALPQATLNAMAQQLLDQKNRKEQEIAELQQDLDDMRREHARKGIAYADAGVFMTTHDAEKTDYENHKTQYEDLDNHIKQYNDATDRIREAEDFKAEQERAFNQWNDQQNNVWTDLEDFWNFMQTGQHIAHVGNTKRRQSMYDKNKALRYASFKQYHGMAA